MADTIVENMEELRTKEDLRRELIANVLHDLRSPLSSIQGYLETIMIKEKKKTIDQKEQKRYLEITCCKECKYLVDDHWCTLLLDELDSTKIYLMPNDCKLPRSLSTKT